MKKPIANAVLWGMVFSFLFCSSKPRIQEITFFEMDTYVTVKLVVEQEKRAREAFNRIQAEAIRIQNVFSEYKPGSETHRINHRPAGTREMEIDSEVARLTARALEMARRTDGYFDITTGPLKWMWGFGTGLTNRVPSQSEIDSVLLFVGYQKVRVDTVSNRLFFDDPRVQIDLGGIAGGYAVARFARIALDCGIQNFLIDDGGDIYVRGRKPDGRKWVVGLRNPRKEGILTQFELSDSMAIVTSGDYEQFFMDKGKRYHHLFNPFTGYPADSSISVTVFRRDPVEADVFSTSVFVMGPKRGLEFLDRNGIDGLIIHEAKGRSEYLFSRGLKGKVEIKD